MVDPTRYGLWWRPKRTTTCMIVQVWSTSKIKIDLSWLIEHDVVYHEKHTKRHNRWYKCDLRKIRYWNANIDRTIRSLWERQDLTTMQSIVHVCSMSKTKLNYHDWFDRCSLCQNWNWVSMTKWNKITTRSIIQFRSTLKWNWTIMTNLIGYGLRWRADRTMMWLIVQVWFTSNRNWIVMIDQIESDR